MIGSANGKGHARSESHSTAPVPPTPTSSNNNWKPPATPSSRDVSPSINPITAAHTPSLFSVATATPRFPQAVPLTVYRKTAPSQMLSEADQLAALKNVEIAKVAAEGTKEMPAAVAARKVEMKVEPERNKAVFGAISPTSVSRTLKPRESTHLRSWHQPDDKESLLMDEPDEPSPAQDEKIARAARKRLGLVGFASSNAPSSHAALELDPNTHHSVLASKTEMEVERMYAQIISPSSHHPLSTHSSSLATNSPQTPGRRAYSHQGLPISMIRTGSINYSLAAAMRQREAEKRAALRSAGSVQGRSGSTSKQNSARPRNRHFFDSVLAADDEDEDDEDEEETGRSSAPVSRRQLPPVGTTPLTSLLNTSSLRAGSSSLPPTVVGKRPRNRAAALQKKQLGTATADDPTQLGQLTHPPLHSANGIDSLRGVKELTSEYVVFGARSPGLRSNAAATISRGRRQADGMAPSQRLALDHWQPGGGDAHAHAHASPSHSTHPMEEKSNLHSDTDVFASVNQVYPVPQHRGAPSASNDMFTVIRRRSYRNPTPMDSSSPSPLSTSSSPLIGNSRPSSNYLLSPSPITPSQQQGEAYQHPAPLLSTSSSSQHQSTITIPRATNPALLLSQQHQLAFLIQEQTSHRTQLLETQQKEELKAERLKAENRNELFHFEEDESAPSVSNAIAAADNEPHHHSQQQLQTVWQLAFSLKFAVNITPGTDAWIEVAKYDPLKKNFVRILTSSPQTAIAGAEVKFAELVRVPPDTLSIRIAVYASDPTNDESSSSSLSPPPRLVDTFIHSLHDATDGASQLFTFVLCPDPTQAYPRADDFTVLHVDINQTKVPMQQLQATKPIVEANQDANISLAPLTALPPLNSARHQPEAATDDDDGMLRFGASASQQPPLQFIPLVSAPVTNGVSRANSAQVKLMPSSNIGIWTSPHSSLAYSQLLKAVPKPVLKAAHSLGNTPGVNIDSDSEDETMYDMRSPVQIPHPPPVIDLPEEERNRRLAMFDFELQDDKVLEA